MEEVHDFPCHATLRIKCYDVWMVGLDVCVWICLWSTMELGEYDYWSLTRYDERIESFAFLVLEASNLFLPKRLRS